ncbi:unnamed protein product [Penicillium crustosum]
MGASEGKARWASQRRVPRASRACETCRARKTKITRLTAYSALLVGAEPPLIRIKGNEMLRNLIKG